jgi:hypothetical protein
LCERVPSLTVPSSGFLNLSTAFSTIRLTGLFHPAATYRVHPVQGLLPSCSSSSSSKERLPPCRFTNGCSPPRWLPPPLTPTSRLCSTRRSVVVVWG